MIQERDAMPFKAKIFQKNVEHLQPTSVRDELLRTCSSYIELTTPKQKAHCIFDMMSVLDRSLDESKRREIMESCGRHCIGASILEKARRLWQQEEDLDSFLISLNKSHIGGGQLSRSGDIIFATYNRCYCGSVSHSKLPFSSTYCRCSCGWFKHLFETVLRKQVEVTLLSSIIQGDKHCTFAISFITDS